MCRTTFESMAEAELIEQLRAQVLSLKSPRRTTPTNGTNDSVSTGSSSRGRITAHTLGGMSGRTSRSNTRVTSSPSLPMGESSTLVNVGGVSYRTTLSTLKCVESSYLAMLVHTIEEGPKTEDGHLFIDRNGELFAYVLEYLRGYVHRDADTIELPTDLKTLRSLKREADFYRLPELGSLIQSAIQAIEHKDDNDNDADSNCSVIVREDEPKVEREYDVVFHSIPSPQCHFSEDRIQELIGRVNYLVSIKQSDGFKVKSAFSDVVYDPSKNMPFVMFMHVMLWRDRPQGNTPFSPTKNGRGFYTTQSFPQTHHACDQMSSDGVDHVGGRLGRHTFSPTNERTQYGSRLTSSTGTDIAPESVAASMDHRSEGARHHRSPYRPRYTDHGEWEYDEPMSPRSAGLYQPSNGASRRSVPRTGYTRHQEPQGKVDVD